MYKIGCLGVIPMDGQLHATPPLGHTSQGIDALFSPTIQEARNMLKIMKTQIYNGEEHNCNKDVVSTFL